MVSLVFRHNRNRMRLEHLNHVDAKTAFNVAQSMMWNVDTQRLLKSINEGVSVSDKTHVRADGWALVGRYAAGKPSARVQAHKIRQRWPDIDTKVIGTEGERPWQAEVWAKRRGTSQ